MDAPLLRLSLAEPPRVAWAGVGTHGPGDYHWRLPKLWCLHAYSYDAELRLDDRLLPIRPGSVSVLPAGGDLHYRFPGECTHACLHFVPAAGPARWSVPAMQQLGARFADFDRGLREAIAWFAGERRRSDARLWDLLWSLASAASGERHPLVERARSLIELRLGAPIAVATLARELGCSHNHLTRLFRSELGASVAGWIRSRRAQRARHLLLNTSMPIAEIAAEVGIPDPHHFNKVIRRELGKAPRVIRDGG
jgi:AraC-like DNA-binding protein